MSATSSLRVTRDVTHGRRQPEGGRPRSRRVVKRARVLEGLEAEADLPYEETALARKAVGARRRLAYLLVAAALACLVAAIVARSWGWAAGALALGAAAWGVRAGRLGAIVASALAALVAFGLALRVLLVGPYDAPSLAGAAVALVLAAASAPDLVTLVRDAELQHAYGRWARRA